jgi:hypothetical protein
MPVLPLSVPPSVIDRCENALEFECIVLTVVAAIRQIDALLDRDACAEVTRGSEAARDLRIRADECLIIHGLPGIRVQMHRAD